MTWDGIYNALRDFIYNYTELAIWLGLLLLAVTLFWMMVYSISVRRNVTIIAILVALIVGAAVKYGYIEWPFPVEPTVQEEPLEQAN